MKTVYALAELARTEHRRQIAVEQMSALNADAIDEETKKMTAHGCAEHKRYNRHTMPDKERKKGNALTEIARTEHRNRHPMSGKRRNCRKSAKLGGCREGAAEYRSFFR